MRNLRLPTLSILTLSALATACSIRVEPEPEPQVPRVLYAFESCDDLLDYAKENAKEAIDEYGGFYGGYYAEPGVGEDLGDTGGEGSGGDTGGGDLPGVDYSETNVQEAGVDEPDLVKTDGERIMALAQGSLHYVDASGASPVLRSSLAIEQTWGAEMFLYEDRVLLFQHVSYFEAQVPAEVQAWLNEGYYAPITRITEVDIADPEAMKVVSNLYIRGDYVSARLVDGSSRVVLQSYPSGLALKDPYTFLDEFFQQDPPPPYPQTEEAWASLWNVMVEQAKAYNKEVIDGSTVENWLPHYVFEDLSQGEAQVSSGLLYECVDAMHPGVFSGLGVTSVLSIDLEKGLSPNGGIGLFAEGSIVYASQENLYVATQPWAGGGWVDGGGVGVEPEPIPDGGGDVPAEPATSASTSATGGGSEPAPDADAPSFRAGEESLTSYVHKFAIPAGEKASYLASGEVKGRMVNQWAMSEHLGDLRIATTDQPSWDNTTWESFVTVLREQDGELVQIGQVGGLGKGEEIKAVRFIRNIAYVVTFRQTDPLYAVDVTDPAAPAIAGELKINGYSAYLHPIDDDHLIGVGFDGTPEGQVLGVQISLFDVSDPQSPVRTHQHALGDFGSTEVAFDHRAFLYWQPTELAVFPVQWWGWDEVNMTEDFFYGAVGYSVDPQEGISEVGTVTHVTDELDPWKSGDPSLRRSLVIGEHLYTVSDSGLKASSLGLVDQTWIEW